MNPLDQKIIKNEFPEVFRGEVSVSACPGDRSGARGKVGAPVGNTNALKHGLYSRHISIQDDVELDSMSLDKSEHELSLARVRLKECIARQQSASDEDWHKYEKAISRYLTIIVNLTNKNALLGRDRKVAFVTVMEMIRQMNERQNVR